MTAIAGELRSWRAGLALGNRRDQVLGLAALTFVVHLFSSLGLLPDAEVGTLRLPLSALPALALAVACGDRLVGRSVQHERAVAFWVVAGASLAVLALLYSAEGRLDLWVSLLTAALAEELIYRLALPAVGALVLRHLGVAPAAAHIAGLAAAGLWFVLLPGHRAQMTDASTVIPFVAFAALSAIVVYRSGSVLPMAAAHAATNLGTVAVWAEAANNDLRAMVLGCVMGLLVLAYGRPRRITLADDGGLLDVRTGLAVAAVDLGAEGRASLTLADGSVLEVDGPLVLPVH